MKTRKIIALVLAVIMVLALAACTTGSGTSANAGGATAAGTPANPYAKHMDISYASNYMAGLADEFALKTELEEMFNVTFDMPDIDLNADFSTFQLQITAGEVPDVMHLNQSLSLVVKWYEEEIIRTIPVEKIRTFAPAWAEVIDAEPAGWKVYPVEGTEDEIMAMTGYIPGQMEYGAWIDYYRYDWLQNLGVEIPGEVKLVKEGYDYLYYTEETFTLDQQYDIFAKALANDPNGNGQADEKITTGYENYYMHGFQSILGAFGLVQNKNIEVNGVTKMPYATENFKNAMMYLNKLYNDGMIDEDFASSNWSANNKKYRTGVYLYHAGNADYIYDDTTRAEGTGGWARAPFAMITDNPEGTLIMMPPVKSESGVNNSGYYAVSPFRYQTVFSADCDDAKMERILSIFNYSMWDNATYEKFYYGEEGVHYTLQDNGKGDMIRVADPVLGTSKNGGLYIFSQGMWSLSGRGEQFQTAFAKAAKTVKTSPGFMAAAAGPHRLDLYNETNLAALEKEYNAAIETIVNEWWIGVVCGTVDAEATWDSYLAQLDAAGYGEIEAELNKAPIYTDLFPNAQGPHS